MNWTLLGAGCTALLLIWRLTLDYVPMFPLNDLTRKSLNSRDRDWTMHYIPLGLALLLNLSPFRAATALGVLIACLYAAVQVVTGWLPYWTGGSEEVRARWEQAYAKTHRFLPAFRDHPVPNTAHVITGVLALIMVTASVGHLLAGNPGGAVPTSGTPDKPGAVLEAKPQSVETAFTQAGQKPDELMTSVIGSAKATLDIAINAINHEGIVNAIIDARIRGVQVRVITDRGEAANPAQAEKLRSLLAAGIPVKENARKGLMDLKMSLVDDHTATTGSFNYTVNASTANDEMLVVIRDPDVVKQWKARFEAMWNDTQNFRDLKAAAAKK